MRQGARRVLSPSRRAEPEAFEVVQGGATIPGLEGRAAFTLDAGTVSQIPVLICVPHAGRCYPPSLLAQMRAPDAASLRLEDRLVDRVARAVAQETGAALLVAHAPRAMIDLNRSPEDMDWTMVAGETPRRDVSRRTGARARGGLGLVPRRLPDTGEIWRGPMTSAALEERLARIHRPYHAALAATLAALRRRWGAALLLDLHSMPPLGKGEAQFVIGDRFGSSCAGFVPAIAFDTLSALGLRAAHNRPYAGGYVLDRHGAPSRDVHAMQLEICRAAYLDSQGLHAGEGLDRTVNAVATLVRRLAAEVAAHGGARDMAAQ